jgi:ABC-type multidrug transport system fused ATPase/permease subunit
MLGQKRQKRKLTGNDLSIPRIDPIVMISFALLIAICMYPELSLASSFEAQLDKTNTLVDGKGKTIGITVATVLATVVAMAKGNPKVAATVVGIGVTMGLFLEWVKGGMTLMS